MEKDILTPLENKERFIVTQANNLVEANYSPDLTARAHKIARLILSLISPDDKDIRKYTISLKGVRQYLGMNANTRWGAFYDRLKETAERLNSNPIEIKEPNGEYLVAYFLSGYRIDKKRGTITFEISSLLKPYLLELKKNYTSYLLAYIPKLRSSYSLRLYELLYQFKKIGKRSFELEDLQRKVGSSYSAYADCKRYVILQAQKDLKKYTNITFTFTEKKTGRKVTGIDFIILGNKPKQDNPHQLSFLEDAIEVEEENPAFTESIVKTLNELGISEQNIAKYLALGFDIIEGDKKKKQEVIKRCQTLGNYYLEKLELTKQSNTNGNAAGFFIKALKEDWVNNKTLAKAKSVAVAKRRSTAKKEIEKFSKKIDQLSKKKKTIISPIVESLIKDDSILQAAYNKTIEEMSTFIKNHIATVLHLPIREQYEQSVHISSGVGVYLFEHYPDHFSEVSAIDTKINEIQKDIQEIRRTYPSIR
ncbi:MAG: replication initiation protein [Bacteroidota bacterium]